MNDRLSTMQDMATNFNSIRGLKVTPVLKAMTDIKYGLITQLDMAVKYDESVSTISMLKVTPVIKGEKKKPSYYWERDLAAALIALYKSRCENYMDKAKKWKDKAREVKRTYEGGGSGAGDAD